MKVLNYNLTLQNTLKNIILIAYKYRFDTSRFRNLSLEQYIKLIKNIPYDYDEVGVEILRRPLRLFQMRKGDCDDKTIAILAYFFMKNYKNFGYALVQWDFSHYHILPFIVKNNKLELIEATYPNKTPFDIFAKNKYIKIKFVRLK